MICRDDRRREEVRKKENLNGLDYVEVEEIVVGEKKQPLLRVYLLGKFHGVVNKENVRIDGGVRVKGLVVTHVKPVRGSRNDEDDVLEIRVNQWGDFSTYTLHVVKEDEYNRPGTEPLPGFDPLYAKVDFVFRGAMPAGPTCAPSQEAMAPRDEPEINYLAKDYTSFRQLIFDRLATIAPAWQERHVPDSGLTLIEVLAYIGDQLSYYQDAVATEAYLHTARQRISIRRHLRLIDYALHDGCNARAWVCIETEDDFELPPKIPKEPKQLLPTYYFVSDTNQTMTSRNFVMSGRDMDEVPASQYEVFEPIEDRPISLYSAYNCINFYTWDHRVCVLQAGATSATLRDENKGGELALKRLCAGEVLIFEEVKGLRTGNSDEADPTHRHVVRLTKVTPGCDELHAQPVVHIEWDREDALPFPFVISAIGEAPCCELIGDVSVARGNVVLVDHGRTVTEPEAWIVPPQDEPTDCEGEGQPADTAVQAAPFHPALTHGSVTQAVPFPDTGTIARHQARVIDQIIRDLRLRVVEIWRAVQQRERDSHGPQAESFLSHELDTLEAIFGSNAFGIVQGEGVAAQLSKGLKKLLLREGQLLQPSSSRQSVPSRGSVFTHKMQRLFALRERAYSGYRLTKHDAQEVGALFDPKSSDPKSSDPKYSEWLNPTNPRLYGSAQHAIRQNVREALPALTVQEERTGEQREEEKHEEREEERRWRPRRDLLNSRREDRHVVVEVDDREIAQLRFGNGDLGREVQPGVAMRATYRVGNGARGNVVAGAISHLVYRSTTVSGSSVVRVRNPLPAQGGIDPEPISTAKLKAPASLRSQLERAVVAEDYARLAERHPNVQRAAAELRWAHGWYEVRVFIDPLHGVVLEEGLRDELARSLHAYRRIGHEVVVLPARYVPLEIALTVTLHPHQLVDHVLEELRTVLGTGALPGGRKGFFHPDLLTFGDSIYLSGLVAAAQAVAGVRNIEVTRFQRLGQPSEVAIEDGVLRIGLFEIARLDNNPNVPEWGILALTMRGGR
ncbi:MAG: putative baseplate assembly protein [Nitrospira sp.]|nr:putative baseplate assembly protein [Nitrospira sp.]